MSGAGSSGALGQHFLAEPRLARELVAQAGVGRTDLVVEIEAGDGRLTRALADRAGQVVAVERDARLLARARRRLEDAPHVSFVHGDALAMALPGVPFRVLANLPFAITGAVLRLLLDDPGSALRQADLVVSEGVARKRTGAARTRSSAHWGAWFTFRVTRRLPSRCFRPPPRVDAAVLRITRRAAPLVPVSEHESYAALLRAAYLRADRPLRDALHPALTPAARRHLRRAVPRLVSVAPVDLAAHDWAAVHAVLQGRPAPADPQR